MPYIYGRSRASSGPIWANPSFVIGSKLRAKSHEKNNFTRRLIYRIEALLLVFFVVRRPFHEAQKKRRQRLFSGGAD